MFLKIFFAQGSIDYKQFLNWFVWHRDGTLTGTTIKSQSMVGLKSEFSFSYIGYRTKAKEPSLPCYLPRARRRIVRFMAFLKELAQKEMQTASSKIWTWLIVSISCVDNRYA